MKPPKMIDNKKNGTVAEELRLELTKDSKLSVMTAYFTIFAFAELKKELMNWYFYAMIKMHTRCCDGTVW